METFKIGMDVTIVNLYRKKVTIQNSLQDQLA